MGNAEQIKRTYIMDKKMKIIFETLKKKKNKQKINKISEKERELYPENMRNSHTKMKKKEKTNLITWCTEATKYKEKHQYRWIDKEKVYV